MKASPGRAVGLARLGTRGRRPDDLGGGVLFAATLGPDDQAFLLHAAAVVGTGGGILSHAGLMAVQCGRPAVIMTGTWRDAADGTPSLVYLRTEFDERERTVEGHRVVERCGLREYEERVREGDVVVVDADEGVVRVLGQGPVALALHDALEHLERTARRLAAAISPEDVLAHRGRRLRAVHQLEKLVARIDEPALVQHAVRELLAGSAAGTAEGSLRDTVHLLRLFCGHPATGTLAAGCVGRIAREVAARHASAHDLAVRRIPTARSPDEVLVLRRSALQLCDTVEQVRNVLAAAGAEAPPSPRGGVERIDALARHRLEAMRDTAVTELRSASQRDPQPPSLRHVLRLAQRLVEVVGAPLEVTRTLDAVRDSLVRRDEAAVRRLESRWVLWPDDGGLELEPLAGSKAANLAELGRVGAAALVPSWFVVTDRAFRAALGCLAPARPGTPWQAGGTGLTLGDAIEAVVSRTDADPEQKSSLVGQLWADVRLPPALLAEVTAAYRRLADDGDPYVAIRSSAREEDTETAARAGEFDTFLFVKGAESVVQHLRRAWSGLWTARAIHDRAIYGRGGRGEGGGILVQRIAWSRVAGVLQTTNVAEGRSREMVVNAGLGLGEGVVSGLVAADHVVVSRDEDPETEPLRFHYVTADKRERVIFDERAGHGTVRTDVLAHQRLRAALEYVELVELVRVATRLEAVYGYPLDIEFGLEHAALRILQVRPVPGALAAWRDASETHPLDATRSSLPTARSADATADEPAREQRGPR
jgi:pyruvate,water dikinase